MVEAARNGIMVGIYENLKNLSIFTSNITRKSTTIEKVSKEAHLMLINALLKQDEEKSERLMRDHLRDTCRQIVEQFYPNMLGSASNIKSQAH
jgi:DNA-binding GntR family transcriptional regulator